LQVCGLGQAQSIMWTGSGSGARRSKRSSFAAWSFPRRTRSAAPCVATSATTTPHAFTPPFTTHHLLPSSAMRPNHHSLRKWCKIPSAILKESRRSSPTWNSNSKGAQGRAQTDASERHLRKKQH
jgi:hypothetical protein